MELIPTELPEVLVICTRRFGDRRGFFSEIYSREVFARAGIDREFVQDNHSLSEARGVLRGLHFQVGPKAQDKLVRVVRGAIWDVAVDLRVGSPNFGRWAGAEISAENWRQLFVPRGFAHGFVTLEPNTEVCYKVSDYYSPEHERGLAFDDPDLNIAWPIPTGELTLSERDRTHPALADLPGLFTYDGAARQTERP